MAEFAAEVYQNEFLPDGGTDVHAIVTVTCTGCGRGRARVEGGEAAEIIIVDTSGSMAGRQDRRRPAGRRGRAIDQILDGTWFAVIAGTDGADRAFPYPNARLARWCGWSRVRGPRPGRPCQPAGRGRRDGDRLLAAAGHPAVRDRCRTATQRHAILLTDGKNQSETDEALHAGGPARPQGVFQCDCRGVGADWDVASCAGVATALLGTVDLIPDPAPMAGAFADLMQQAMGRGVADAQLRVWAPQGAQVLFVRQVVAAGRGPHRAPASTSTRSPAATRPAPGATSPATTTSPSGSPAKPVGSEQLAARVQLAVRRRGQAQALVKALWSDDDTLTTRINPAVAHYTGQAELAEAIQEGLAAKAAGDEATATAKLGRAVQLAEATGNDEATTPTAQGRRHRRPGHGYGPAQARRRQARRDGAGHELDEDDAGQEVGR